MTQQEQLITTEDVSINTVSIEVKVMKIGKKQVTLAVFRQLPEEQIVDDKTGALLGIPWGRVNYCPDCSKEAIPHFHIVWQKGNELRRATIEKRWCVGPDRNLRENLLFADGGTIQQLDWAVEKFLCAATLQGWEPPKFERGYMAVKINGRRYTVLAEHVSSHLEALWKAQAALKEADSRMKTREEWLQKKPDDSYYQGEAKEARERLEAARQTYLACCQESTATFEGHTGPIDTETVYRELVSPAWAEYDGYIERWKASYSQLAALDQLFIAV